MNNPARVNALVLELAIAFSMMKLAALAYYCFGIGRAAVEREPVHNSGTDAHPDTVPTQMDSVETPLGPGAHVLSACVQRSLFVRVAVA